MRAQLSITAVLLVLLCCTAAAETSLVLAVPDDEVLTEPIGDGGGEVCSWAWGVVIRPAGEPQLLPLDDSGFAVDTTAGLTTYGPRDSDGRAALTFLIGGTTVVVDGDVQVETHAGRTVISATKKNLDPRAGLIMFLGILILTAVMMRQTRRNISSR